MGYFVYRVDTNTDRTSRFHLHPSPVGFVKQSSDVYQNKYSLTTSHIVMKYLTLRETCVKTIQTFGFHIWVTVFNVGAQMRIRFIVSVICRLVVKHPVLGCWANSGV